MLGKKGSVSKIDNSVTSLLGELGKGTPEVEQELVAKVYLELQRIARSHIAREREGHTLEPTALVHEAYARLIRRPGAKYQDRVHFFATASRLMRNILVDHARSRNAGKRGGVCHQVTLTEGLLASENRSIEVLGLHHALDRLAAFDAGQARIVELHFFGGLTMTEISHLLQVSERTIHREWSMARAWLRKQL